MNIVNNESFRNLIITLSIVFQTTCRDARILLGGNFWWSGHGTETIRIFHQRAIVSGITPGNLTIRNVCYGRPSHWMHHTSREPHSLVEHEKQGREIVWSVHVRRRAWTCAKLQSFSFTSPDFPSLLRMLGQIILSVRHLNLHGCRVRRKMSLYFVSQCCSGIAYTKRRTLSSNGWDKSTCVLKTKLKDSHFKGPILYPLFTLECVFCSCPYSFATKE